MMGNTGIGQSDTHNCHAVSKLCNQLRLTCRSADEVEEATC